jgi:hypothetical protein
MGSEEAGSVKRGIGSLGDDSETSTIIDGLSMDYDCVHCSIRQIGACWR